MNGFRIELGEIETVVHELAEVLDCCAVVSRTERPKLVLFVTVACSESDPARTRSEPAKPVAEPEPAIPALILATCKERLPRYMVPSVVQIIAAVPLTNNGKVNRQQLQALATSAIENSAVANRSDESQISTKGPTNERERVLLGIVAAGLHVQPPSLSVLDNFFDLGADSLSFLEIVARCRKCGFQVSMQQLFQNPTVSSLARVVEFAATDGEGRKNDLQDTQDIANMLIPLGEDAQYQSYELVGIQRGYWIGLQLPAEQGGLNNHFYREYTIRGLDMARAEDAVNDLIARHHGLRSFVTDDGHMRVLRPSAVPRYQIDVTDLSQSPASAREAAVNRIRDKWRSGPSAFKWPMWQMCAIRVSEDTHIFVLDTSIMAADGPTSQLLRDEFFLFYVYGRKGAAPMLSPLRATFRDYSLCIRTKFRQTAQFKRARRYWLDRVTSLPPPPELPVLRSTGFKHTNGVNATSGASGEGGNSNLGPNSTDADTRACFEHYGDRTTPEVWERMKRMCTRHRSTPNMVFITLYAEALARHSRNSHFLLTVMHTKRWPLHADVPHIVGNFAQTVLLAVDVSNGHEKTFSDHVRATSLQLTSDLDNAAFCGTELSQAINAARNQTFEVVSPFACTSTLAFDALPEARSDAPSETAAATVAQQLTFSGTRGYSCVQVPHTWMDHQVAEDRGCLLYNFDVLKGKFPPGVVQSVVHTYAALLHRLARSDEAWDQPVTSLIPSASAAAVVCDIPLPLPATSPTPDPTSSGDILKPVHLFSGFIAQTKVRPHATAVLAAKNVPSSSRFRSSYTYRELDIASHALASRLVTHLRNAAGNAVTSTRPRASEVGDTGTPVVAVMLPKSVDQIVAVLAVLRAGCAYMPLDPLSLPLARMRSLLTRADCVGVVVPGPIASGSLPARLQALLSGLDCVVLTVESAATALVSVLQKYILCMYQQPHNFEQFRRPCKHLRAHMWTDKRSLQVATNLLCHRCLCCVNRRLQIWRTFCSRQGQPELPKALPVITLAQ